MGGNKRSKKSVETVLIEKLGLKGLQFLYKLAQERDLNSKLLLYAVRGEVAPVDGRSWPKTWCSAKVLEKRLSKKGKEYWDALKCNGIWWNVLQEWNDLVGNKAKQIRVFGKVLLKDKVYPGSRKFWDFLLVVRYMLVHKADLEVALKVLYGQKVQKSQATSVLNKSGITVLEDGE